MNYRNKPRLVDALRVDPSHPLSTVAPRDPNRRIPENLADLEYTLRAVIEAMVLQRLDAISESVRHLEAASEGRSADRALVWRLPVVLKLLGISKSTLYAWLNPKSTFHDPSLPKPIRLGDHAHSPVVWRACEIESWIEARACASRTRLH